MICANCGAENPDGSEFCSLCFRPTTQCHGNDTPAVIPVVESSADDVSITILPIEGYEIPRTRFILENTATNGVMAGLSVACLICMRIAAEILVRTFTVHSASFSSRSGMVFSTTLGAQWILLWFFVVLIIVGTAACLSGFRAQKNGAMLGGILAAGICAVDGILSLLRFGSFYRIVDTLGSTFIVLLGYFAAGTSVLVLMGILSGYLGERLANGWRWGDKWTFEKLTTVAVLAMSVFLLSIGITGTLAGSSVSGPSLETAYAAMRELDAWRADICYAVEGAKSEPKETWVYDGVEESEHRDYKAHGYIFDAGNAAGFDVLRELEGTFEGEDAICYMLEAHNVDNYENVWFIALALETDVKLTGPGANRFEAIIWISPSSNNVLGMAFQLRDSSKELSGYEGPGSGGQLVLSFSELGPGEAKIIADSIADSEIDSIIEGVIEEWR